MVVMPELDEWIWVYVNEGFLVHILDMLHICFHEGPFLTLGWHESVLCSHSSEISGNIKASWGRLDRSLMIQVC